MNDERFYCFLCDLVCKQFIIEDFRQIVISTSARAAWRKFKDNLPLYFESHGYSSRIKIKKIIFTRCLVFSSDYKHLNTLSKIS